MFKILSIISASLVFANNTEAASVQPTYQEEQSCCVVAFFSNTLGQGEKEFKALSEYPLLGDPLFYTQKSVHESLSEKIDILDRANFARFAQLTVSAVLTEQAEKTDPYCADPYAYVRTVLNCTAVAPENRNKFLQLLTQEFQPGFNAAGKSCMVRALANAYHMNETVTESRSLFTSNTSSYERSLIWSGFGMCRTKDDVKDVADHFSYLLSSTSTLDNSNLMSFEHQETILRVLATKDKESRSDFALTIKPLTDRLTANGKGWTIAKLAGANPKTLSTKIVALISYVDEQKPDETAYLKHIGALN